MNALARQAVATDTNDLIRAALAAPDEAIARHVLNMAGVPANDVERSITTATGLVAYDLQAPAKNLYPFMTPIRNRVPRRGGGIGTATNWKAITAIIGSGFDAMGWVPEGQRSGRMSYATANVAASFVTLGEEDQVTFEAINAGRSFEDVEARMSMRLLQKTMLKEERAIVGGNKTIALGTPVTPTVSASGAGATLPAATYVVYVVALTYEGYMNSSLVGGVATSQLITGADGETFTLNGGSSNKSAASAGQIVTLGQTLFASTTAIRGAVAYAWYVGVSGSEKLEKITTINSAAFTAPLIAGAQQAATAVTADRSLNATAAFDGLLTAALASGSNAYVKQLASGVAGAGTPLTSSGRGSVTEIDDMLQVMWDTYRVSPSVLYVNSQELRNITNKCLTGAANAPLLQVFKSPEEAYGLQAGGTISWYYNPFSLDGGQRIPVQIHPDLTPGTILGWADNLPLQYQSNEVPNCCEIIERQGYYQIDWPIKSRRRERGVYVEEVLANYAPFAMGVINNIGNG
jgi:hypothetical protein